MYTMLQISFLNQLVVNEQALDSDIIFPTDNRWNQSLLDWDACEIFALDIETYGSEKNAGLHPWKGQIRLIQIGLIDGRVLIVDFGGYEGQSDSYLEIVNTQFLPRLQKHMMDKTKIVLGMNLKFDLVFLKVKFNFEARTCSDVRLISQVIWAGLPVQHSLKAIAARCGIDVDKTEQSSEWGFPLNNNQLNYAAKDVKILFPIVARLRKMVQDANLKQSVIAEMLALPCFVQFEYYGMPVDYDLLIDILAKYHKTTEQVLKPFTDMFPGVNPDSSQQVIEGVRQKLDIHLNGTAQEHLAPYWDKPELKALSLWRTLTTYIDYLENVKKCYFDGSVRGVYRQTAPKGFGRSTCGADKKADRDAVNLQNPPNMMPDELKQYNLPKLRTIFKTKEDQLLISDLSSAHARIATEASKDRKLIEIYNSGADLHSVTASGLAKQKGKDWDDKYIKVANKDSTHTDHAECGLFRQVAKMVFYSSLNWVGWTTFQANVKKDSNITLSDEDSKSAIKGWQTTYKDLYYFQQQTYKKVNQKQFTFAFCKGIYGEVRGLSNRRIFMEFRTSDFRPNDPPQVKNTDCVSFVWTSTEADIMKTAMGLFLLGADLHPEWCVKLRNMAHDELDVTCCKEYALSVATFLQQVIRNSMEKYIKSIPPDDMDAKPESLFVNSWADK